MEKANGAMSWSGRQNSRVRQSGDFAVDYLSKSNVLQETTRQTWEG